MDAVYRQNAMGRKLDYESMARQDQEEECTFHPAKLTKYEPYVISEMNMRDRAKLWELKKNENMQWEYLIK